MNFSELRDAVALTTFCAATDSKIEQSQSSTFGFNKENKTVDGDGAKYSNTTAWVFGNTGEVNLK